MQILELEVNMDINFTYAPKTHTNTNIRSMNDTPVEVFAKSTS